MKTKMTLSNLSLKSFVTEINKHEEQTIVGGATWLLWELTLTLDTGGVRPKGSTPACTTGCKSGVQI